MAGIVILVGVFGIAFFGSAMEKLTYLAVKGIGFVILVVGIVSD